jgi:hypothetical protein
VVIVAAVEGGAGEQRESKVLIIRDDDVYEDDISKV